MLKRGLVDWMSPAFNDDVSRHHPQHDGFQDAISPAVGNSLSALPSGAVSTLGEARARNKRLRAGLPASMRLQQFVVVAHANKSRRKTKHLNAIEG